MLSNHNQVLLDFVNNNKYIEMMMYKNDDELESKIKYYLSNDAEREYIASEARKYILENHSYESRCRMLYDKLINKTEASTWKLAR